MLIRIKKDAKSPVITCIRDDGSATWSKMPYGEFFPRHDLMHYAVETTLGFREAFFGLIASGRTIESFNEPGAARQLPPEAQCTEYFVDQLEREHRFGECSSADEFNAIVTTSMARGGAAAPLIVSQKQLDAIRSRFVELLTRYGALPDGKQLELKWKPRDAANPTFPSQNREPAPEGYRRHIITAVSRQGDNLTIEYEGRVFAGITIAELPPGIAECIRPGTDVIVRTHTAETGDPGQVADILIPHPTENGWAEIYADY